jgi:hypothetical protein
MAIDPEPRRDLPDGGFPLPTLDHLGVKPEQLPINNPAEARQIAEKWFKDFVSAASSDTQMSSTTNGTGPSVDTDSIDIDTRINTITSSLFHTECYWRDILALTWDFRTFSGPSQIKQFLKDRLQQSKLEKFKLDLPEYISAVQQAYSDMAWIQFMFSFRIGDVGIGSGIGRLVPVPGFVVTADDTGSTNGSSDGNGVDWKCHTLFTHLEDLQGFPEKIGPLRNHLPSHGVWLQERQREKEFRDKEPTVVVVGGSQSGLTVGARLKMLDVPTLIVDKLPRIGDNWRNRYEALCLHFPICECTLLFWVCCRRVTTFLLNR